MPFSGTRLNDDLLGVACAGYRTVPIKRSVFARLGRQVGPLLSYRPLRRLPGQDFHLLEHYVFQDAPSQGL